MSLVKILCGASAVGFALISSMAEAQSNPSPPFVAQQPLTAAQLNAAFAAKSDYPGHTPVTSFNTRGGAVTLTSPDVTNALGYIPISPSGGDASSVNVTATGTLTTRTLAARFSEIYDLKDFGAKCDGSTNDTAAITAWLAKAAPNVALVAPAGVCDFASAQSVSGGLSDLYIGGQGRTSTIFQYTGSNTTNDLLTIGSSGSQTSRLIVRGFRIQSTTVMTGGAALRITYAYGGSEVSDFSAGVLGGNTNLYKGIWFDNINVVKFHDAEINVSNEGEDVNGLIGTDNGSDLYMNNLTVVGGTTAFHIGGGMGGIYFGNVLAFGQTNHNVVIDNTLVARRNREFFFSDLDVINGSTNEGLYINDTLTSGGNITFNADEGGSSVGLYVVHWPSSRITIGDTQIFNNTSDGIKVDDTSTLITTSAGTQITNNGGYAINATADTREIYWNGYADTTNLGGITSAHVLSPIWTSYTPTVTCTSGTLTTYTAQGFFHKISGVTFFSLNVPITTNGSCASGLIVSLPSIPLTYIQATGTEYAVSHKMLQGTWVSGGTMSVTNYDGTYPGANNAVVTVAGSYDPTN